MQGEDTIKGRVSIAFVCGSALEIDVDSLGIIYAYNDPTAVNITSVVKSG